MTKTYPKITEEVINAHQSLSNRISDVPTLTMHDIMHQPSVRLIPRLTDKNKRVKTQDGGKSKFENIIDYLLSAMEINDTSERYNIVRKYMINLVSQCWPSIRVSSAVSLLSNHDHQVLKIGKIDRFLPSFMRFNFPITMTANKVKLT